MKVEYNQKFNPEEFEKVMKLTGGYWSARTKIDNEFQNVIQVFDIENTDMNKNDMLKYKVVFDCNLVTKSDIPMKGEVTKITNFTSTTFFIDIDGDITKLYSDGKFIPLRIVEGYLEGKFMRFDEVDKELAIDLMRYLSIDGY